MEIEEERDTLHSTQNTQYDEIGTEYNAIKVLPSVEPEEPSVVKALGNIEGKRCLGMCKCNEPILHHLLISTDLACGTGKMTHLLARLGASSVLGYDIPSSMIEGACATYPINRLPKPRLRSPRLQRAQEHEA
jgi:2-polyprenyl-3-methyl-5-hydroxy-6-metoxy-1,4-benzoquinol methylase